MTLRNSKRGLAILLLLVFLLPLACDQQSVVSQYPLHYSDAIMGTSFTVKISTLPDSINNDELKTQIKGLLDKLNSGLSTYQKDSELSLINSNPSLEWIAVSESLYAVLKQAKDISELSNGAFDITVGPLVNLWGFGPDTLSFKVPETELINDILAKTGYKYLLFDDENNKIRKVKPGLYLDLSAIAKGYAVDQVGLLLEKQGIVDYMVEIGGEIRLKGKNRTGRPWQIAVEKPESGQRMIQKVLPLTDVSIATSGDYRNYFEVEGVSFSHTIEPYTGRPVKHKLASITILSNTTMKADALATALMVLGPEQGYELAEKEQIAAMFIINTKDGFVEKVSSAFKERLK